uniref:Uncharacterized protein n=1 Tax=Globodera rostochiensis TaxID=31243 RepID=A0A914H728_GLORO
MNKFNCAHCVVLPLLVLNIIVLSVSVHGGDGVRPCPSDAETESPIGKKQLWPDLIALEREEEKKNSSAGVKGILSDLLAMERIQEEEFDQFWSIWENKSNLLEQYLHHKHRKIVSGLGRQLKKYLHFTIMFLAKRQRIAATEIVPLKSGEQTEYSGQVDQILCGRKS